MKKLLFILIPVILISCKKNDENKPIAEFSSSETILGVYDKIDFLDQSLNEPTQWKWEFEGGEPDKSSERYPNIEYNSPGVFYVKLTVSNSAGSNTTTKEDYITVGSGIEGGWTKVAECKHEAILDFPTWTEYKSDFAFQGEKIFIGTFNQGMLVSHDNGSSWILSNYGINKNNAEYIYDHYRIGSVDVINENIIITANDGIYISTNNAGSWEKVQNGGLYGGHNKIWSIDNVLYSINTKYAYNKVGIYKSTNFGFDWELISTIPNENGAGGIGFSFQNNFFWASTSNGLFYSTDNCNSWTINNNEMFNERALAATTSAIFAIHGYQSQYLASSTDNGNTWTEISPPNYDNYCQINGNGDKLFWNLFLTKDNGSTLIDITDGITFPRAYKKIKIINSNLYTIDIHAYTDTATISKRSLSDFN